MKDNMGNGYDAVVTWQADSLTEITLKHNWDTIQEAETWIMETMTKAIKDNPDIEMVSADWEHCGCGKTFELRVGF